MAELGVRVPDENSVQFDWTTLAPLLRLVLIFGGFAAITVAAWLFHVIAGLAVLGVSMLLVETLWVRGGGQGERANRRA